MNSNLKKYLASFSFITLLIITYFGTSVPFSERIEDVEDIGASNMINQLVYGFLFISSVILLFRRKNDLWKFIVKEKFLSLLILWCIITLLWSPDAFVSLKRIFRLITVILVSISFLFYSNDEEEVLNHFKYVLYTYLFLSIIVVLIIPQAKDPQFGTWRGFTPHKNGLGGVGVVTSIISYMLFVSSKKKNGKIIAAVMILISVALVVGSFSSTAISAVALLFSVWLIFSADKIFKPIGVSKLVSVTSMVLILLVVFGVLLTIPDAANLLPEMFGKDSSYSGRTDLWEYIWNEIMKHPIQGVGYQGFWNVNRLKYSDIYEIFLWLPQQSHNGYLDILNEIGAIGMVLLLSMVGYYLYNYRNAAKPYIWIFLILIPLLTNFSESSFLRPGKEMNFIFLFAYIHLFYSLTIRKTQDNKKINSNVRRYR
jgi:O-antigen ligase